MSTTDDPNDPGLRDIQTDGMQRTYLVLSDAERALGFVRPVRMTYKHEVCGTHTTMGRSIAETYARDPHFYDGTFCVGCHAHFPVGESGQFVWVENGRPTDLKVGV